MVRLQNHTKCCKRSLWNGSVLSIKPKLNNKHKLPRHYGRKAILSQTNALFGLATKIKSFDFYLKLHSIGDSKTTYIPLKRQKQFNKLNQQGKIAKSITLTKNYIQFSFEIDAGSKPTLNKSSKVLGLDTGITNLLATSEGYFYGKHIRTLIESINNKKHGSKNQLTARRRLRHALDVVAKLFLLIEKPDQIIIENLKNITKNTRRRLPKASRKLVSVWNVKYFLDRLKQQCDSNRVRFATVSAYNTSITCSKCDHADKNQRLGSVFKCMVCGYYDHADHNAALNIKNRLFRGIYCPSILKVNSVVI